MRLHGIGREAGRGFVRLGATLVLTGLLSLAGCASTGSGDGETGERRDLLTREQIAEVDVYNLYDVVQRLRPTWLTTTGRDDSRFSSRSRVLVVENGNVLGGAVVLREIAPEGVTSLRYERGDMAGRSLVGGRSGTVEAVIVIERGG